MSKLGILWQKLLSTKVLENFSMMSLLNVAGALIGFVTYPFVIRALGAEAYGLNVLAVSIVGIACIFFYYGFDIPCAKMVVAVRDNRRELGRIVSAVVFSRLVFWAFCSLATLAAVCLFSSDSSLTLLVLLALLCRLDCIFLPVFYYQGLKRMRVVTAINLTLRLLSVPVVLLCVRSPHDVYIYAGIVSASGVLAGLASMLHMLLSDKLCLRPLPLRALVAYWREATPFFLSELGKNAKTDMMSFIIGVFFGTADLAIFDLAQKVLSIPRMLLGNINKALFPEVIGRINTTLVRSILRYETIVGVVSVLAICAAGYPIVYFLGGADMLSAYPVLAVLGITLLPWLVVGACQDFIFVPAGRYYLVTQNQLLALSSSVVFLALGLWLSPAPIVSAWAVVLSAFGEVVFCIWTTRRERLLANEI